MRPIFRATKRFYGFEPFRLDAERRLLYRDEQVVPLPPRALQALLILVDHRGETLSKDQLMKELWPDTVVEENSLTVIISTLRKALGERPNEHRYVVTVPGRGYRFVAGVEELELDQPEANPGGSAGLPIESPAESIDPQVAGPAQPYSPLNWRKTWMSAVVLLAVVSIIWYARTTRLGPPADSTRSTLAVLPFQSLGSANQEDFLGLGMADAIITRLSHLRKVFVRPVTAVIRYADAKVDPVDTGHTLQVDSLLHGSAQRIGDRIRVTATLVRVVDGQILWTGRYDEAFKNVFAIEDQLSEQIAQVLMISVNREEKQQLTKRYTANTEAYQLYLRGRYFWNKRTSAGIEKATDYFQKAAGMDPQYALAYAGLADCYNLLSYYSEQPSRESFPKAKGAALKALSLDDSLAEAHASLALARMDYDWDWQGAESEFRRSIQLNPNYPTGHQWYGEFLAAMGRRDEAAAEMHRAIDLDPLSLIGNTAAGYVLYYNRRFEESATQLQRTVELDSNFWAARWFLGWTYEVQGQSGKAIAELEHARQLSDGNRRIAADLARSYAVASRIKDARSILKQLTEPQAPYVSPYALALVQVALGDREDAFRNLRAALDQRAWELIYMNVDPRLDPLRSDPRFLQIAQGIGLHQ